MDDTEKDSRQQKEMSLILSRMEHVLEHGSQDNDVIAACIFLIFIELVTEIDNSKFKIAIKKICELRNERIKLKQSSK